MASDIDELLNEVRFFLDDEHTVYLNAGAG